MKRVNAPGSLETLRRRNRGLVLRAVQSGGATSRVDIVRATGLSRTTVSSLVNQLIAQGLLAESTDRLGAPAANQTGRPPTRLTLEPSGGAVLGIHLRHDGIRLALADLSGAVLAEALVDLDVDHRADAALSFVEEATDGLLVEAGMARRRLLGAAVAISSPVPTLARHGPSLLTTWHDIDVADALTTRLGVPVQVGNDANLGATAKRFFGAARTTRNLVYVMLAEGVGAGLYLDSHAYFGGKGVAGEFGHVVVAPGGRVCRCGNRGCLETVASTTVMLELLGRTSPTTIATSDIVRAALGGDHATLRIIDDAGLAVGRSVASIVNLVNPETVVIGGPLAGLGELLLDPIRRGLAIYSVPMLSETTELVMSSLGEEAEALGAVALVLRQAGLHTPIG